MHNFRTLTDHVRWTLRRMRVWQFMRYGEGFGSDIDYCLDNDTHL